MVSLLSPLPSSFLLGRLNDFHCSSLSIQTSRWSFFGCGFLFLRLFALSSFLHSSIRIFLTCYGRFLSMHKFVITFTYLRPTGTKTFHSPWVIIILFDTCCTSFFFWDLIKPKYYIHTISISLCFVGYIMTFLSPFRALLFLFILPRFQLLIRGLVVAGRLRS